MRRWSLPVERVTSNCQRKEAAAVEISFRRAFISQLTHNSRDLASRAVDSKLNTTLITLSVGALLARWTRTAYAPRITSRFFSSSHFQLWQIRVIPFHTQISTVLSARDLGTICFPFGAIRNRPSPRACTKSLSFERLGSWNDGNDRKFGESRATLSVTAFLSQGISVFGISLESGEFSIAVVNNNKREISREDSWEFN